MSRQNLVDITTGGFSLRRYVRESARGVVWSPSSCLSSPCFWIVGRYNAAFSSSQTAVFRSCPSHAVNMVRHRFETVIAGREYLIEVARVAEDRWRAQIVRIPGLPTALMPFYGATPDEAAAQLSDWLTRAHRHASLA